ncbi:thiazole biosynthesis protein ThiJ [Bacteroidia bacterium]|nr:thiazole biosynthesis protein ThiJ [Bacteroidia bacterium]
MKKAFLFLVDGFEEIEAIGTIDILRRGGVDVKSVSLEGTKQVTSSRKVVVLADLMFGEADFSAAEMLVLPGGTVRINEHEGLKALVAQHATAGKKVAAICAAPMVLGGLGLLKGKTATAYPGFEKYLDGAKCVETPVAVDGNIITGRGPGLTMEFALTLVAALQGQAKADEVAADLLLKSRN